MIEIDECHRRLIGSMVAAAKPERILELGFGTGLTTQEMLLNLCAHTSKDRYGSITLVDNWHDLGGDQPCEAQNYMIYGVKVVTSAESHFLCETQDNTYDFLVSDADHKGDWCEQHFRVTKTGSWCFFHDTNQPHIYPGLARTVEYVKSRGWTHYHFTKSTLPGEECHRGLLMVLNEKDVKP